MLHFGTPCQHRPQPSFYLINRVVFRSEDNYAPRPARKASRFFKTRSLDFLHLEKLDGRSLKAEGEFCLSMAGNYFHFDDEFLTLEPFGVAESSSGIFDWPRRGDTTWSFHPCRISLATFAALVRTACKSSRC
jgi:hypothetical protein